MDLVTKEEMKIIDTNTCNRVKSINLMESAGKNIALEIIKDYSFKNVLVLCGTSGNGGDGFVVARYLLDKKYNVDCFLIGNNLSDDCLINKERFNGNIITKINNFNYIYIIFF